MSASCVASSGLACLIMGFSHLRLELAPLREYANKLWENNSLTDYPNGNKTVINRWNFQNWVQALTTGGRGQTDGAERNQRHVDRADAADDGEFLLIEGAFCCKLFHHVFLP